MARTIKAFQKDTLAALGERANDIVKTPGNIHSKTLLQHMKFEPDPVFRYKGRVGVPHYWAEAVHEGRKGFGKKEGGRFLVFFPNPQDDPRNDPAYPVKLGNRRTLSEADYKSFKLENARRRKRGENPIMIIIPFPWKTGKETVGDTYSKRNPFFNILGDFAGEASVIVAREARRYAIESIAEVLK
jgi:hypothetical protein